MPFVSCFHRIRWKIIIKVVEEAHTCFTEFALCILPFLLWVTSWRSAFALYKQRQLPFSGHYFNDSHKVDILVKQNRDLWIFKLFLIMEVNIEVPIHKLLPDVIFTWDCPICSPVLIFITMLVVALFISWLICCPCRRITYRWLDNFCKARDNQPLQLPQFARKKIFTVCEGMMELV